MSTETVDSTGAYARALAHAALAANPNVAALHEASMLAHSAAFDERIFRDAFRLTDVADGEGAAAHLVSEVRVVLIARLRDLVARQGEIADAATEPAARRRAFVRLTELGVLFVDTVGAEWARALRLFHPMMAYAEMEIGGLPSARGDG